VTDAYGPERIRGKTVLWTWTDGPTKGMTHEHVFHPDGTVEWREIDRDSKPPSEEELRKTGPARKKVEYAAGEDVRHLVPGPVGLHPAGRSQLPDSYNGGIRVRRQRVVPRARTFEIVR
jgi:hypothetical protein